MTVLAAEADARDGIRDREEEEEEEVVGSDGEPPVRRRRVTESPDSDTAEDRATKWYQKDVQSLKAAIEAGESPIERVMQLTDETKEVPGKKIRKSILGLFVQLLDREHGMYLAQMDPEVRFELASRFTVNGVPGSSAVRAFLMDEPAEHDVAVAILRGMDWIPHHATIGMQAKFLLKYVEKAKAEGVLLIYAFESDLSNTTDRMRKKGAWSVVQKLGAIAIVAGRQHMAAIGGPMSNIVANHICALTMQHRYDSALEYIDAYPRYFGQDGSCSEYSRQRIHLCEAISHILSDGNPTIVEYRRSTLLADDRGEDAQETIGQFQFIFNLLRAIRRAHEGKYYEALVLAMRSDASAGAVFTDSFFAYVAFDLFSTLLSSMPVGRAVMVPIGAAESLESICNTIVYWTPENTVSTPVTLFGIKRFLDECSIPERQNVGTDDKFDPRPTLVWDDEENSDEDQCVLVLNSSDEDEDEDEDDEVDEDQDEADTGNGHVPARILTFDFQDSSSLEESSVDSDE